MMILLDININIISLLKCINKKKKEINAKHFLKKQLTNKKTFSNSHK